MHNLREKFWQIFLFRGFKTILKQWPKRWEHCKELDGDYFEKVYVANTCSS
jgi:hypothetical protein